MKLQVLKYLASFYFHLRLAKQAVLMHITPYNKLLLLLHNDGLLLKDKKREEFVFNRSNCAFFPLSPLKLFKYHTSFFPPTLRILVRLEKYSGGKMKYEMPALIVTKMLTYEICECFQNRNRIGKNTLYSFRKTCINNPCRKTQWENRHGENRYKSTHQSTVNG